MGTGQMLMTVGAMVLLSVIVVNIHQGYLINDEVMLDSKFDLLAISLAISVVEDAKGLAFDELTSVGANIGDPSEFSTIGRDGTEFYISRTLNTFNDFDDFDGLHVSYSDSTLKSAIYIIDCKAGYISDANPDNFTNSKTFNKKLDVMVSSPSMTDTIRISTVMSYFYFR